MRVIFVLFFILFLFVVSEKPSRLSRSDKLYCEGAAARVLITITSPAAAAL